MKTAMQEMLERVKEYRDSESSPLAISILNSVYVDILGMLDKEKEQIMDAHSDGALHTDWDENTSVIENAQDYYNETFNTKEK